jgi:hypothetical protein
MQRTIALIAQFQMNHSEVFRFEYISRLHLFLVFVNVIKKKEVGLRKANLNEQNRDVSATPPARCDFLRIGAMETRMLPTQEIGAQSVANSTK